MAEEHAASVIVLVDEDGNQHEFEVLDAIETDDGRYVALLPLVSPGQPQSYEYYIMQVVQVDGQEELADIDDDSLLDELAEVFESRIYENYADE